MMNQKDTYENEIIKCEDKNVKDGNNKNKPPINHVMILYYFTR